MDWRKSNWWRLRLIEVVFLLVAVVFVSAQESSQQQSSSQNHAEKVEPNYLIRVSKLLSHLDGAVYKHDWPDMRFGWKIVVGTFIGFLGAAFGSVGGVGGGGFFVPMLTLIIGFDQKSSTAISKCMITGGAAATVLYNLRLRHPTLELPLMDYDLALLFQPMLVLGISIGVSLNVVLSEWMIAILLIIVLLGTSTKSFFKGVETWKKETATKKEFTGGFQTLAIESEDIEGRNNHGGTDNGIPEVKETKRKVVSVLRNVYWRQLGVIFAVWIIILGLQIGKNYVAKCSVAYWILDFLQIPVTVGVTSYEAVKVYKGQRVISSRGEAGAKWRVHNLVSFCFFGIIAGLIGGLLGLGGGFIMGPLFLEMGVPPQVASATSTFIMLFSSSMSVVEYDLLKRFPIPYALYFTAVAIGSAIIGQHVVGKMIKAIGRASLIIFILAFTIFVSALTLGGVGIANLVKKIEHKEYLGFQSMCTHKS
ncbi:sulfite exporter TauE/SafE family protein 3 isoform X2 [Pyrus x bretschneideri]|uniref:sulfite exporter TauE/SafE family protein 3 isoform X2 n=1 Tax=Pyrus x bretschneideri TaxID=225117 RepID=UPI0020300DAE|nr:sulfite exporter TauE/SafE family protein 3 isoform X2 [Pyrus x bretschneideri]